MSDNSFSMQGTITALITPFNDQGEIDYKSLDKLIDFQVKAGVKSFVVCGSTGEAANLSDDEYKALVKRVREICASELQCIAGIGVSSTNKACEMAVFLREAGVHAALTVTPPYVKPTQDGILEHFRAIKKAADLPLVAYNIPGRSGTNMHAATIQKLAKEELVVGLKDSTGSIDQLLETVRLLGSTPLDIVSGEDNLTFNIMACGGVGVISASANAIPEKMLAITSACSTNNWKEGLRAQLNALPSIKCLFSETNPIPAKAWLYKLGIIASDFVRLPLTKATPETYQLINTCLS